MSVCLNAVNIVEESGVNDFSVSDLSKILAGKTVSVDPYIDYYFEGFRGNSSPKDLTSLFELTYLYFTDPREDTASFRSFINKQKGLYKNLLSDPVQYYYDQYRKIKTNNHPLSFFPFFNPPDDGSELSRINRQIHSSSFPGKINIKLRKRKNKKLFPSFLWFTFAIHLIKKSISLWLKMR